MGGNLNQWIKSWMTWLGRDTVGRNWRILTALFLEHSKIIWFSTLLSFGPENSMNRDHIDFFKLLKVHIINDAISWKKFNVRSLTHSQSFNQFSLSIELISWLDWNRILFFNCQLSFKTWISQLTRGIYFGINVENISFAKILFILFSFLGRWSFIGIPIVNYGFS